MRNLPQTGSYLLKNIFIEYVIRDAWTRKYHYNIVIHADHRWRRWYSLWECVLVFQSRSTTAVRPGAGAGQWMMAMSKVWFTSSQLHNSFRRCVSDNRFTAAEMQVIIDATLVVLRRHSVHGSICPHCRNDSPDHCQVTDVDTLGFITQVQCLVCGKHLSTTCRRSVQLLSPNHSVSVQYVCPFHQRALLNKCWLELLLTRLGQLSTCPNIRLDRIATPPLPALVKAICVFYRAAWNAVAV